VNKPSPAHSAVRRPWRRAAIFALCATAAGCATQPAPPPGSPPPSQPAGPVSFNGTYNGLMQLVRSNGPGVMCGTQDTMTITVAANAFHYMLNQPQVRWQPFRAFDVVIGADGSFQQQSGAAYINGRISGGHMQGEIAGDACGYRFEADRAGTW